MSVLWRGSWTTRIRIASGLVLFTYVLFHFLNIGTALISPEFADAFQQIRQSITRSVLGTLTLYGALTVHAVLALSKIAFSKRLRLSMVDLVQVGFGVTIPLLLATHIVHTRLSHVQFETVESVSYLSALIWNSQSGWNQSILMLLVWTHGCLGLHMWLKLTPWWQRNVPLLTGLAALVPAFALFGFIYEGRRTHAIVWGGGEAQLDFFDATNWPGPSEFAHLREQADRAFWVVLALLSLTIIIYVIRQFLQPRRSLQISYVDGPVIKSAPGPTLLEMSQTAGVPHTALCGGRGRCTTCRVIVEEGAENVPPAGPAELRSLTAVKAPRKARLACQMRPTGPCTVYRAFRPDGRLKRGHASEGKEARIAILFLDMRGFTARTAGQLPYDVVFLLNRFFDAIVPPIIAEGGTIDKYLGDGLLALFEMPAPQASAQAGLRAARKVGEALVQFNEKLAEEGEDPVRIGLAVHMGTVVLGEIGAAGQSPRTLIGDAVNTASRLESETKAMKVEGLMSEPLLSAAGIDVTEFHLEELHLRGVAQPLKALPVPVLSQLDL